MEIEGGEQQIEDDEYEADQINPDQIQMMLQQQQQSQPKKAKKARKPKQQM